MNITSELKKSTSNIESVPLLYISSPGGCLRSHFLCEKEARVGKGGELCIRIK